MKIKYGLLCIIVVIAGWFRLYQLGNIPPSPDWDEAALGYNAYSILKTGRDEFGTRFPLSIRSFDDYKPPLYTYLTIPSVALFGLTTWSTRLPSVVMGILAVIGAYFLVEAFLSFSINDYKKYKNYSLYKNGLALLSSLLLALSPWHIQFSRIAFEANIGITINIWAFTFFFLGLIRKRLMLIAAFLFGLGFYAYHSERVFIPLMLLLLFFLYRKDLLDKRMRRSLALSLCVGLLIMLPLIPIVFGKTALLRFQGTSSFSDQLSLLKRTAAKLNEDKRRNDSIGEFIDNRRFVYAKTIVSGYLSHYSLKWLFLTGDNQRHHAPDMGLMYVWELPFLLLGLIVLAKIRGRTAEFLFGWLLIAPVAAAPTSGLPHAIRTLVFLPVPQIVTAVGIVTVFSFLRFSRKDTAMKASYILSAIYCLFILFNIAYYCVQYFLFTNREYSNYWQYGMKEAVEYTESVKDKYKKIVVSTELEQSYMFYLFFLRYDPKKYLEEGGTQSGSFAEEHNGFDKYEFRPLDWNNENFDGTILYVGSPKEMPHGNNAHITFLDGKPAVEIKDRKD